MTVNRCGLTLLYPPLLDLVVFFSLIKAAQTTALFEAVLIDLGFRRAGLH